MMAYKKTQSSPRLEKWVSVVGNIRGTITLQKIWAREYYVTHSVYQTKKAGIGGSSEFLHKKIKHRTYSFKTYKGALNKVKMLKKQKI